MKQMVFALALIGLSWPAHAQMANHAQKRAVIEIFNQHGCSISEVEAQEIFPAAGLNKDVVSEVAEELRIAGALSFMRGRAILAAPLCTVVASENLAAGVPVLPALNDLQEQYVYIMSRNDCRIKIESMIQTFGHFGLQPPEIAYELEEGLSNRGILKGYENGTQIGIVASHCTPASEFPELGGYQFSEEEQFVVEMLEFRHCRIKASEIEDVYPADVYDLASTRAIFAHLLEVGVAKMTLGNDIISISPEKCLPWSART